MKPRSDSLYAKLVQLKKPDHAEMERLDELMLFLKSGHSYEDAAGLCHEWGVHTSETSVCDFYSRHAFSWAIDRARAAAAAVGNLPSVAKEILQASEQKVFELTMAPETKDSTLVAIRAMELERVSAERKYGLEIQKVDVSKRRVSLLEKKMAQASAKLQELRDPAKADDPKLRQAILDRVDELMGIAKKPEPTP
jgi:hypothetical protein